MDILALILSCQHINSPKRRLSGQRPYGTARSRPFSSGPICRVERVVSEPASAARAAQRFARCVMAPCVRTNACLLYLSCDGEVRLRRNSSIEDLVPGAFSRLSRYKIGAVLEEACKAFRHEKTFPLGIWATDSCRKCDSIHPLLRVQARVRVEARQ